jgi:hypothetical protein
MLSIIEQAFMAAERKKERKKQSRAKQICTVNLGFYYGSWTRRGWAGQKKYFTPNLMINLHDSIDCCRIIKR